MLTPEEIKSLREETQRDLLQLKKIRASRQRSHVA